LTIDNNSGATQVFIGFLTGNGTLIKSGANSQEIENDNTGFTGTVIINQGLLHLDSTSGAMNAATSFILNGPTSSLLSDQDQDDDENRIGSTATITLNNTAGISSSYGLRIRNDNDQGEIRNETVGAVTIGAGHNVITAEHSDAAVNTTARLTSASFARNNRATILMRGENLGAATGNRGSILFTAAPTGAIGGGGAAGTTTMSIIPHMIGDITAASTGLGNSLVIYDATLGVRPLDLATEYIQNEGGYNGLSGVTTNNMRFAANPAATLTGGSKSINSLVLDSTAGALTISGNSADSLTVTSGAILAASTTNSTTTVLNGFANVLTGGADYTIYTTNATQILTIDSALTTTAAALVKSGAGTLVLTNTGNSFNGGAWFNQGVVEAAALGNLGTGPLNFFGGSLKWGTSATFDISSRVVTIGTGGATLDVGANNVDLAASIGAGGAGGLTKTGAGTLTLNAPANYLGDTVISAGVVTYGVNNALPATTNLTLSGATLNPR
jgi:autotransporter-associated beta strand protein